MSLIKKIHRSNTKKDILLRVSVLLLILYVFSLFKYKNCTGLRTNFFSSIAINDNAQRNTYHITDLDEDSPGGLNRADRDILVKYFSKADSVIEWGVGTSTNIASSINIRRYTGIDSSIVWLQHVKDTAPAHFRFVWADVGKLGNWGTPIDKMSKPKWSFYSKGALAQEAAPFDVYFVDGRFRVACALASFIHALSNSYSPTDYVVIVHDFRMRTKRYGVLLDIADSVDGWNDKTPMFDKEPHIVVLRLKPNVQLQELEKLYNIYINEQG